VPIQIVGILAKGKYLLLREHREGAAFFPISQQVTTKTSLIVWTRADFSDTHDRLDVKWRIYH
jgi:hypothetical protein